MKTIIDNRIRVFQITTSTQDSAFCNLQDLNHVMKELGTHEGYYNIYHFWNGKQKKISNKELKALFDSAGIIKEFY